MPANGRNDRMGRFLKLAAVLGAAGAFFAAGTGFGLRIRNIDDAPRIHRELRQDVQTLQAWVCDHERIPATRCPRWIEENIGVSDGGVRLEGDDR